MEILNDINKSIINIKQNELINNYKDTIYLNNKLEKFIIKYVNKYHHNFLISITSNINYKNKLNNIICTYQKINKNDIMDRIYLYRNLLNNLELIVNHKQGTVSNNIINNNLIDKINTYHNFNFIKMNNLKEIHNDTLDNPNYCNVYNNFLLDDDKYFMSAKLHTYKYILNSPIFNDKIVQSNNNLHNYFQHLKVINDICSSRNNKKVYRYLNKYILENNLIILNKLQHNTPKFYKKHKFSFNVMVNFINKLLDIIDNNGIINLTTIDKINCDTTKNHLYYGILLLDYFIPFF